MNKWLGLFLALYLGWVGFHSARAAHYSAIAQIVREANPSAAFGFDGQALEAFSWPTHTRRQLVGTFQRMANVYRQNLKVQYEAANRIFSVGFSVSPYDPLTLVVRAQHMLNYGNIPEADKSLAVLREYLPNLGYTWWLSAWSAALKGDMKTAENHARTGRGISYLGPDMRRQLNMFVRKS